MKNYLRVNMENRSLIMDKTFAKNAAIVGSPEYIQLQAARRDYEGFNVVQRHIKTNPNKECFNGLTYAYMEDYIKAHESGDALSAAMEEYEELRLIASCHSKCHRYPTIKKWFLEKYPAIKEYGVVALGVADEAECVEEGIVEDEAETPTAEIVEMPLVIEAELAS